MAVWGESRSGRGRLRWARCALVLIVLATVAGPAAATDGTHVVVLGETLRTIARDELGDPERYRDILAANPQITDPDRIPAGITLVIPARASGAPERSGRGAGGSTHAQASPRATAGDSPARDAGARAAAAGEEEAGSPGALPRSVEDFEGLLEKLGVAVTGLSLVLAISGVVILALVLMRLLFGALFLWAAACAVGVPDARFGRCFKANFLGLLYWLLTSIVIWVIGAGICLASTALGSLASPVIVLVAVIMVGSLFFLPFLAYVLGIRGSFETGFFRALGAAILMVVFEGIVSLFLPFIAAVL